MTRGPWRLPGLGAGQGVEETGIRLPPLQPGQAFCSCYDVGPGSSAWACSVVMCAVRAQLLGHAIACNASDTMACISYG